MTTPRTPVVFIHGLWLHATSWNPWLELFRDAGYDAIAPGWPGDGETVEETRAHPERVAGYGIEDATEHYAKIISTLWTKPILVGHSFGGLIAQKLLGRDLGAAAVAVDAVQIKGVLPLPLSSLRVASTALKNPANRNRAISLTLEQFRYGFGNAISAEESAELHRRWTIPSPGKPLFEAAAANLSPHSPAKVDTDNPGRGPLLLITGGRDHTVPESITRATLKKYRDSAALTDLDEFPDRGHSLTVDSGWRAVADRSLAWLRKHSL